MSIKQNGTPAPSRFKLASPTDPKSFAYELKSFVEELQEEVENPSFNQKDKQNISWLNIYFIPEKIIQTLKKLSMHAHASKVPGLHSAIRCAIKIGLPQVYSNPYVKELKRLELCFNQLPQIGEPREMFVERYLTDPLIISFEGRRYNIPVMDDMKRVICGVSNSPHIREHDIVTWAIHLALLRRGNDVPENYREEWTKKVADIEGLIQMKIVGAVGMLRELPGGKEIVSIVTPELSELDLQYFSETSEYSSDSSPGQVYKERETEEEDVH